MENNSTLEKILWVFNRNAELLGLVWATLDSKVASDHSEKFAEKKAFAYGHFFVLFVLSLFTFELSNINWKCSEHIYMLTEHTHDSAVFEIFYWTIINWNFIWNIVLNNGIYWDLRNKSVCLNTVLFPFFILILLLYFCLLVDHVNKRFTFVVKAFVYNFKNIHNWPLQRFGQDYGLASHSFTNTISIFVTLLYVGGLYKFLFKGLTN